MIGRIGVIGAGVALLLAVVPSAYGVASFRTPGNAAFCGWSEGEGSPHLICWTPNDGFTISMPDYGRASRGTYDRNNIGWVEPNAPVLRFGRQMRWGPTRCQSRASGLTCTNGAGHGWWLGRYRGLKRF